MTFLQVVITIILLLIFLALMKRNSIKSEQSEAKCEKERLEAEELLEEAKEIREEVEELCEYEMFFAKNGYPHHRDSNRILAWGAKHGMNLEEARESLSDCEFHEHIGKVLDKSSAEQLAKVQEHGWHAAYAALAFTPEQRTGQDYRPIHGMIWKDDEKEKYFLNLTDLSEFVNSGCSPVFPLKVKSIPQETFTIEKEQNAEWRDDQRTFVWVDIE